VWGVENRPLPLTRPMANTTACTTVQAVIANISMWCTCSPQGPLCRDPYYIT